METQKQRAVTFGHIRQLEREIELLKSQLKELKAESKEEVEKINKRINDLENKHTEMMLIQTEMRQDIRHVNETLKILVSEVKIIGEEIIRIKTAEQIEEKNQEGIVSTLVSGNMKLALIGIVTISLIILSIFGIKPDALLSFF